MTRRDGASWAFQNGVPLEQIMKHGTWKSDAVWSYLSSAPSLHSPLCFILPYTPNSCLVHGCLFYPPQLKLVNYAEFIQLLSLNLTFDLGAI